MSHSEDERPLPHSPLDGQTREVGFRAKLKTLIPRLPRSARVGVEAAAVVAHDELGSWCKLLPAELALNSFPLKQLFQTIFKRHSFKTVVEVDDDVVGPPWPLAHPST